VAKGANLYHLGFEGDGSVAVISNFIRTGYLWERVRVQGGAYGGFIAFNDRSGMLVYLSYRDPNVLSTLKNYDGTAQFLRETELSDEEITRNIIGVIGNIDTYQLPDAKGYTSMVHYLTGETDEILQQYATKC